MDLRALLLAHSGAFVLALCRVGGFLAVSPFPGNYVGLTQRVGLLLALSWVAGMVAPTPENLPPLGPGIASASLLEVGCGVALGFGFRLVFSAAEVLGQGLAHASGLSSPSAFNPTLETSDSPLGKLTTLLALLVALSLGAHRVALGYVLGSFRALPLGSSVSLGAAAVPLIDLAGQALAVGVRLSLPAVAVALAAQLALALIARAAPALQIFSVGLTVLVASGLLVVLAGLGDLARGLGEHLAVLGPSLDRILAALAGR